MFPGLPLVTTMFGGHVIVGACISTTVTVKVHIEMLPDESVAVEVTVVVPFGKLDPDAGALTTETPGQLSVAVTEKVTTVEHKPGLVGAVMFAGHVIDGGCASFTVTVNVHDDELPDESDTLHDTVVTPFGNVDPLAGLQVGEPTPGQLSLTVGFANVAVAEHWLAAVVVVMLAGQVIEGG